MSKAIEYATMLKQDCGYQRKQDYAIADELERLAAIEQAALKFIKCKGRYHAEQNTIALGALLGIALPPSASSQKPSPNQSSTDTLIGALEIIANDMDQNEAFGLASGAVREAAERLAELTA